jgi:hypothetical protein
MRFEHVADADFVGTGRVKETIHIALRIDDDAEAVMAQDVGGIAEAGSTDRFHIRIHRGAAVRWRLRQLRGAVV